MKEKTRYRWAVVFILIAVVVIVALDVFCVLAVTYPDFICELLNISRDKVHISRENAFLSNGLSLIGLAISIWATLNIINVLDKKDVEELRNQLFLIKEEHKELTTEHNYNILRKEFENCSSDDAMRYLALQMSNAGKEYCAQLSVVMQYYSRVYQLNQHLKRDDLLISAADEGIRYVNMLLDRTNEFRIQQESVRLFLHYCKAEFLFYKAYCYTGEEKYRLSMDGLSEYEKSKALFQVKLPKFSVETAKRYPNIMYQKCSNAMGAYWVNTFGESYSKAVQGINGWKDCDLEKTLIEQLKYKAVFYCAYAVEWSGSDNQTYLRNLGCALEAAYGTESFSNGLWVGIRDIYQKAMHIAVKNSNITDKVFYTLLSYAHKQAENRIALLKGKIEDDTWLFMNTGVRCNEQVTYTKQALYYAELAEKCYPDNIVFSKFYAFSVRDLLIWEILSNGKSQPALEYKKQYDEVLVKLKNYYPSHEQWDLFMRSLYEYSGIFDKVLSN